MGCSATVSASPGTGPETFPGHCGDPERAPHRGGRRWTPRRPLCFGDGKIERGLDMLATDAKPRQRFDVGIQAPSGGAVGHSLRAGTVTAARPRRAVSASYPVVRSATGRADRRERAGRAPLTGLRSGPPPGQAASGADIERRAGRNTLNRSSNGSRRGNAGVRATCRDGTAPNEPPTLALPGWTRARTCSPTNSQERDDFPGSRRLACWNVG